MNVFLRYIIGFSMACLVLGGCMKIPIPSIGTDNESTIDSLSRKERKAFKKVAKLIKKYPKVLQSDSSSKVETKTTFVQIDQLFYDANKEQEAQRFLDSLLFELSQKCPQIDNTIDSVSGSVTHTEKFKIDTLLGSVKKVIIQNFTVEKLLKPVVIDTAGIKVEITPNGNKLRVKVNLPVKETTITNQKNTIRPCPECPNLGFWDALWTVRWLIGVLLTIIGMLFFLIVIMK